MDEIVLIIFSKHLIVGVKVLIGNFRISKDFSGKVISAKA